MTEIAVVCFVTAAHRDDFDLRLMELDGRAKVLLRLAEALAALGLLGDRQKPIRHPVIIAGVKKILLGGALMAGGERLFGSRVGLLGQLQPGALPGVLVAGFDAFHRPRDVEDIAAALLRLSDQAQRMTAEWMVRKKEIEHGHLRAALTEKVDLRSRSKTFLALAIKSAGFGDRSWRLTVIATACRVY
ncbi:MAG: hypothetical protein HYS66_16685 [Deltaproteobacteria bacterium]|nr:hypothetical protein [Deltaproteobacteria bacterium]